MAAVCVQNLLIEPDNFGVFYALCQVYTIHDVSHEQEERDFLRQETSRSPVCIRVHVSFSVTVSGGVLAYWRLRRITEA